MVRIAQEGCLVKPWWSIDDSLTIFDLYPPKLPLASGKQFLAPWVSGAKPFFFPGANFPSLKRRPDAAAWHPPRLR
jgi:hypothetical protein